MNDLMKSVEEKIATQKSDAMQDVSFIAYSFFTGDHLCFIHVDGGPTQQVLTVPLENRESLMQAIISAQGALSSKPPAGTKVVVKVYTDDKGNLSGVITHLSSI